MQQTLENAIHVSDKAKIKVQQLLSEAGVGNDPSYFLRVSVVGNDCNDLNYKMEFDKKTKATDKIFEDNGMKIVSEMKSLLYLINFSFKFSDGLHGKGFYFN